MSIDACDIAVVDDEDDDEDCDLLDSAMSADEARRGFSVSSGRGGWEIYNGR